MNDLAHEFVTDKEKAHTDNGMSVNKLIKLIASYDQPSHEQLTNQTLINLNDWLGNDNLIFVNDHITVTYGEEAGEIKPTANSIGAILKSPQGQPSNLAIYPLDGSKPFLLHGFDNDGFVIGEGSELIAVTDIEQAGELWPSLTDTDKDKVTIIAPLEARHFDSLVKAHAKQCQVTIYTDYKAIEKQRKTFKADNVRLVATISPLADMLITDSLEQVLSDPDTKTELLGGLEWSELEPLSDSTTINNPYPLHAFSNDLQAVIERASYYYQTPKSVAGQAVLGALSTMCQPYVNAPFEHSHNPVSLFLLTELPSGGGKTQINKYIYKVIIEIDRELYEQYQQANDLYNNELAGLKPREKAQYIADNPKPKNHSFTMASATLQYIARKFVIEDNLNLAITSGEAGKMMGSHAMKAENIHDTIGTFADLYSGQSVEYNTSGNQKETGKTKAFDRRLTIDISGQPAILRDVINNELLMQQGFLARFLISCEPSFIGKRNFDDIERETQNAWHDPALLKFWDRCKAFYDRVPTDNGKGANGKPERINMPLAGGAMRYLNAYRQHCENRLTTDFKNFQETAQRLAENASRIATLFAYFDGLPSVTIEYLEKGVLLAEYAIKELMRYNDQQQSTQKNDSQKLIEWIVKKCKAKDCDRLNRTYISCNCPVPMQSNTRLLQQELDNLENAGYIQQQLDGKKKVILINPKLLKK